MALVSFALSFAVARTFTALNPRVILSPSGFHVHHFCYGIVMLAVGGWLGISYNNPRVDRVAAIIFGAEGGLTGDEAGILLTLDSNNYWAGVSYTFIIIFLASASILVLLNKYSRTVLKEFKGILWQSKWLLSGRFYCRDVDGLLDRHGRPYGDGCCEPAYDSCMGNHTSILDSKIRGRLRREEIESSPMVTS